MQSTFVLFCFLHKFVSNLKEFRCCFDQVERPNNRGFLANSIEPLVALSRKEKQPVDVTLYKYRNHFIFSP